MSTTVTNYDGSIVSTPVIFVRPESVERLQAILQNHDTFPSPVRAVGSNHSLTPCASSPGTMVSMKSLNRIIAIDPAAMTFTAQAGLEIVEAAKALREQNLQFMLNIEIGNLTLGAAACNQTKDALDGVEFGQVNSYVTAVKWVSPTGTLEEASEATSPDLLAKVRGSYGLAGIVYEVTFRIKPLEIIRFNYHTHDVASLTQDEVERVIATNQAMVAWTIGGQVTLQTRNTADKLQDDWLADLRRFGWNFLAAFTARTIRTPAPGAPLTNIVEEIGLDIERGVYRLLSKGDGFTLHGPDKTIDYSKTPPSGRYAFTFWAFPRAQWVQEPAGLRDVRRRRTSRRMDSAATCRSARTSSGATRTPCCRTPGTATPSRSTRFTRPAAPRTRPPGTPFSSRSTTGRTRAAAGRS